MVECPYCEKENEVNHDDGYGYEENHAYEQRCKHCRKTFIYYTEISFHYEAQKAPCKNGGEHKLTKMYGAPKEFFIFRRTCEYCGDIVIIDEDAHKKSMQDYRDKLKNRLK